MARDMTELLDEIEQLRKHLEQIVNTKGSRTASEVLAVSQALDEVINEYYLRQGSDKGL